MRTKYFNLELLGLLVLSLQVPWPGPTVFKISCPRESARLVRRVVGSKWTPVLTRHGVTLPLECPFHPARDVFAPQEAAKQQHRASQWTCALCGKSFFEERHLDAHFDARHKKSINTAEDAVCLADYCDIMRCEVLLSQDALTAGLSEAAALSTDVEIWREATAYRTALTVSQGTRDLVHVSADQKRIASASTTASTTGSTVHAPVPVHRCGLQTEESTPDPDSEDNTTKAAPVTECKSDLVDSTLPPVDRKLQRLSELKANCKPEELLKLKIRCEVLVRDCIAGLLMQLSVEDFQQVEEELNRAVCWFLTCDRYWEDSATTADARTFPWGLLFLTAMVLSLGLCLCYYIIWVLFDGDDGTSVTSTSGSGSAPPSPARPGGAGDAPGNMPSPDDYNEHYIYVTYPPELKRRLLESCYNRTTRL